MLMNFEQILNIILNQEKSVLSTKVPIFCTAVLYDSTLQVDSNSRVDFIFFWHLCPDPSSFSVFVKELISETSSVLFWSDEVIN